LYSVKASKAPVADGFCDAIHAVKRAARFCLSLGGAAMRGDNVVEYTLCWN